MMHDFSFLRDVFAGGKLGHVVEVGCGAGGHLARYLSTVSEKVTALDDNEESALEAALALADLPNVEVLRRDGADTGLPGAGDVDAVVLCRSLHFVWDVGALMDEVDRLLRPGGGRLVVINSPLFEVQTCAGDPVVDSELEGLVEAFCQEAFREELACYWPGPVSENFARFCNPGRQSRNYLASYSFERLQRMQREPHNLLDLPVLLANCQVCRRFVDRHGRKAFDDRVLALQGRILDALGHQLQDMYFEQVDVMICTDFYIEVSVKPAV